LFCAHEHTAPPGGQLVTQLLHNSPVPPQAAFVFPATHDPAIAAEQHPPLHGEDVEHDVPHTPAVQAWPAAQLLADPHPHVPGVTHAGVCPMQHLLPQPVPPATLAQAVVDVPGTQLWQALAELTAPLA
jgi:hypothetical protein